MKDKIQKSGDNSLNVQGELVHVTTGLGYSDVRDVAMDVFRANFEELKREAAEEAFRRAERLVDGLVERLEAEGTDPSGYASDPGFQLSVFEAQRGAAKAGDEEVEQVLLDLLAERAQVGQRSLKQIVLDECVSVVPKLTVAQMDALALIFLFKYTRNHSIDSIEGFRKYSTEVLDPFLATASRERSDFQHLEYAGIGTIGIGSVQYLKVLRDNYKPMYYDGFTEEEVVELLSGERPGTPVFRLCEFDDKKYCFVGVPEDRLPVVAAVSGLSGGLVRRIYDAQVGRLVTDAKLTARLAEVHPKAQEFREWFEGTPAKNVTLTTVGMALGRVNVQRRTGVKLDLGIWIK